MTHKSGVDILPSIAAHSGIVLLYHATFPIPPESIENGLHNTSPEVLYRHLDTLQAHFTFVSVDEFVRANSSHGLACVSFDDGYKCVLDEALPVFESVNIPITLFVNGSTLQGKIFWRDKVRYLINQGLVEAFVEQNRWLSNPSNKSFYRYSKTAVNNSLAVEHAIDAFLADNGHELSDENYCFDAPQYFINHPLVSYGNHSHSHYVMSSLTTAQQFEEIEKTHQLLVSTPGIQISELFSIPFGDCPDFNQETIVAAREMGYRGVLCSRGKLQQDLFEIYNFPAWERFMPKSAAIDSDIANLQSD